MEKIDMMEVIQDLRVLFAMYDTFHDFKYQRKPADLKIDGPALLRCVLATMPNMQVYKDIVDKYDLNNVTKHVFAVNSSLTEIDIVNNLIQDKNLLKSLLSLQNDHVFSTEAGIVDFHKAVKNFFDSDDPIEFVPDANQLSEKILCSNKDPFVTREYRGYFDKIDAKNVPKNKSYQYCFNPEFQTYSISRRDGSLFSYDSITADIMRKKVVYEHPNNDNSVDITKVQRIPGVSHFISVLVKTQRQEAVDEAIYGNIKNTFGLDKTVQSPEEYVRCLYDIKRSGDYMTVEATKEANLKTDTKKLYVFVSSDAFAIFRAILSGVPAIRTVNEADHKHVTFYKLSTMGSALFEFHKQKTYRRSQPYQPPTPLITDEKKNILISDLNKPSVRIDSVLKQYSHQWNIPQENLFKAIKAAPSINENARKKINRLVSRSVSKQTDTLNPIDQGPSLNGGVRTATVTTTSNQTPLMVRRRQTNTTNNLTHRHKPSPFNLPQDSKQTSIQREFAIDDLMQMFEESHPLHLLLAAFKEHNVTKITVFQYILYRFVCHYSD